MSTAAKGLVRQKSVLELLDDGRRHEATVRRHLLVVTHHENLLATQDGRQRPEVRLARLVHDDQVEATKVGGQRLGHLGVAHHPARNRALRVVHRLLCVPTVPDGIRAGALADAANSGAIGFERGQDLRRCAELGREPCSLRDQVHIEACQTSLQVAASGRECRQLLARLDAVQVCLHAGPVPGVAPADREDNVLTGGRDGLLPHSRGDARRARALQTVRKLVDATQVVRERLHAANFRNQLRVVGHDALHRDLGVTEFGLDEAAQPFRNRT